MLIINLNIRGLGGGTKARYLIEIIASEGVEFVCIQETKTMVFSEARCFALWGENNIGWIHNEGENGGGVCCPCGRKKCSVMKVMLWGRDSLLFPGSTKYFLIDVL